MKKNLLSLLALSACLAFFAACHSQDAQHVDAKETPVAEQKAQTPTVNPEAILLLAKADSYDGEEDKVVGKCAGCALAMDGSKDHQLSYGEYKMNFCSQYCADEFGKETAAKIIALNIPDSTL